MIDFFKKLFGQPGSSATAKERLRLVLMTDHIALAPDMIEQMKRDLVDVISRYVEVDREKVEVNFEQEDRALAMLANIPIVAVNRPKGGDGEKSERTEQTETVAKTDPPQEDTPVATASPAVAAAPNVASPGAHAATNGNMAPPPKRRRRKKSGGVKPATAH